jgi:hypothetical protein
MKFYLIIVLVSFYFHFMNAQTDSLRYIFKVDELVQHPYFVSYTFFSPSIIQVEHCDSLASKYVYTNSYNSRWNTKIENYYDYYRQYVGLVDSIGNRKIFIDAYCEFPYTTKDQIKRDIMLVKGGGSCYFQVKVNLESDECYEFNVNAPK